MTKSKEESQTSLTPLDAKRWLVDCRVDIKRDYSLKSEQTRCKYFQLWPILSEPGHFFQSKKRDRISFGDDRIPGIDRESLFQTIQTPKTLIGWSEFQDGSSVSRCSYHPSSFTCFTELAKTSLQSTRDARSTHAPAGKYGSSFWRCKRPHDNHAIRLTKRNDIRLHLLSLYSAMKPAWASRVPEDRNITHKVSTPDVWFDGTSSPQNRPITVPLLPPSRTST